MRATIPSFERHQILTVPAAVWQHFPEPTREGLVTLVENQGATIAEFERLTELLHGMTIEEAAAFTM
jgi:hypothetical protein